MKGARPMPKLMLRSWRRLTKLKLKLIRRTLMKRASMKRRLKLINLVSLRQNSTKLI